MQLFYISVTEGGTCVLSEEESWHCMKVLRLTDGDPINLVDGKGNFYHGKITKIHHKVCMVEIISRTPDMPKSWNLHIAIAPTKNIDRFEWFLEKATEIGIDEVTPVFCEHSEREIIKPQRLEKVLVSAMKQSLKARLPVLHEPTRFRDFITRDFSGQKFIGHCETGKESELHDLYVKGSDALILIGPEGDFSRAEVKAATGSGFTPVSLGSSRLRTETAGIVACNTINLLNRMSCDPILNPSPKREGLT
jgi:16S rRNA (uracil1498-N3)-methyltransferase